MTSSQGLRIERQMAPVQRDNTPQFDLRSETAVKAAQAKIGCQAGKLMEGIDSVCAQLSQ